MWSPVDVEAVDVVLCDADGTLFDSEGPAFAASTVVTNRLLATLGVERTFTPDGLRRWARGRNFRSVALALAGDADIRLAAPQLEQWVAAERTAVIEHLAGALRPSPDVSGVLQALSRDLRLCIVTSSASARLDACLAATALDEVFPPDVRVSAEDSLPVPVSKPDPAVYRWAGERFGVAGSRGLAIEDTVSGTQSAVAAGFPTVGMLQFVPPDEREERTVALRDAGAAGVVASWGHLLRLLQRQTGAVAGSSPGGSRSGVPSTG